MTLESQAADQFSSPPAHRTMLNPALVAALLAAAAKDFERVGLRRMDWLLSFAIAPLVLHKSSRLALPNSAATHLSTWVSRNPLLCAGFPLRAQTLKPYVREGIRFGVRHQQLRFDGSHLIGEGDVPPNMADAMFELMRASKLLGRWFSKTEKTSTIYALLGLTV